MTRGRWLAAGFTLALVAGLAVLAYGFREATAMPVQRAARIVFPTLPPDSPPLRIAVLSDIHVGNAATPPERLARVVAQVNAARPDAVVLLGDFVNGGPDTPELAHPELLHPLGRLVAPLGVYAVLGNHDHWTGSKAVRHALEKRGIRVLANSAARVGAFSLAGIDDATSGHANSGRTLAHARALGGIPIVVTHSPTIAWWVRGGTKLLLAGHTHCGQVAFGQGAKGFYPTEFLFGRGHPKALRCGIAKLQPMLAVVTAGIGSTSVPLRYNAPPDWWLLTLAPISRR